MVRDVGRGKTLITPAGLGRSFVAAFFTCTIFFVVCQLAGGSGAWASSVVAALVCEVGLVTTFMGTMSDSAWHGAEIPMGLGLFLGAVAWAAALALVPGVIA